MHLKPFGKRIFLFIPLVVLAAVAFAFFSRPSAVPVGAEDPNIVLITVDALRADHLGCYGYPRKTSPNIDALAEKGVLFTQAIAQSSHAPTSLGVIATSAYPPANGLRGWGDALNPNTPNLAETLKSRGYQTLFAGGNGNLYNGLRDFGRGFDAFYDEGVYAPALTQKALSLVEKNKAGPFFLWIHYMDVHGYVPSKELESTFINDMFYSRQASLPIVKDGPGFYGKNGIPESRAQKNEGNDNPDYYIALYDGAIRTVDKQIGLLLKKLSPSAQGRRLLIIFTSDYGEMLGEHGYYFHEGWFLYEPLLRVPLILNDAAVLPAKKIASPVSAGLDIFPTLLGLLKKPEPPSVQGSDLSPLIFGNSKGAPSPIISDEGYSWVSVRVEEWKLVRYAEEPGLPGEYKLYNLKKDPGETTDLGSAEREVFAALKEKLDGYREAFREPASL